MIYGWTLGSRRWWRSWVSDELPRLFRSLTSRAPLVIRDVSGNFRHTTSKALLCLERKEFSVEQKAELEMNRRSLVSGAAAVAGGVLGLSVTQSACSPSKSIAAETAMGGIIASDHNAVVDTTAGRVRGFTRNQV